MRCLFPFLFTVLIAAPAPALADSFLLRPARVFDGVNPQPHEGWSVLVTDDRIVAVGPNLAAPAEAKLVDLPGTTLMPGMIEGHSHLFLHPYNETLWDDQVLHEPLALRTARAVVQAERTLDAGFTTERDLGTEGAGFADVGLKQAIDQGIVPRASSSRPGPSSRAAPTGRRATSPALRCRRARRKSLVSTRRSARCATRSPPAPTSSNSTPTIIGARASRRGQPCRR